MSLKKAQQYLQQMYNNPTLSCMPTGYGQWDQMTGGLVRGGVTLIGGRPGMGQTSLALNIVSRLSREISGTVVIISPQQQEREITVRLLQIGTGVEAGKLLDGSMSAADAIYLCSKFLRGQKASIRVLTVSHPSLEDIANMCRHCADLRLLVVDDAACISKPFDYCGPDAEAFPIREPMEQVLDSLRRLAQDLKIPVICVTRLHRSLERRKDKRPRLKDLEKMNVPAKLADQVVFLYRSGYYEFESDDTAECIIAKTTYGQTGTVRLQWHWRTAEIRET